jgi:hypothetical protein
MKKTSFASFSGVEGARSLAREQTAPSQSACSTVRATGRAGRAPAKW